MVGGSIDNNLRKRFPGGYNMQRLDYNNNNNNIIYRLAMAAREGFRDALMTDLQLF